MNHKSEAKHQNKPIRKKIRRHGRLSIATHWTIALSTLLLIISGMGQMPLYMRYMVTELPGLGWMGNYEIHLILHYIGAAVLVFAAFFHVVFNIMSKQTSLLPKRGDVKESIQIIKAMMGRGEEPPQEKYLAEQRLAYLFIAFSFLLIIVTGLVKTAGNLAAVSLSESVMLWMTQLHNLGMILIIFGVFMHLAAFVIKENRPLVESMFTGKCSEDYAKNRHSKWYNRIRSDK